MTGSWLSPLAKTHLLVLVAIFLLVAPCAFGQTSRPSGTPPDPSISDRNNNRDKDDPSNNYGSPENEMRAKLLIKEEKKRYDENVARAREVSQIAVQLHQGYVARKSFAGDDSKRLERLEKLTKRIRNEAGGSDSDEDGETKDIPAVVEDLLKEIAELADELQKKVEKTPRQVVSAAVIEQANRLIQLVQHARGVSR